MLSDTKFQKINITVCQCVHEIRPVLAIRVYNNIWRNTSKKLLPVRPKVLQWRRKKRKERQLQIFLRYMQTNISISITRKLHWRIIIWIQSFRYIERTYLILYRCYLNGLNWFNKFLIVKSSTRVIFQKYLLLKNYSEVFLKVFTLMPLLQGCKVTDSHPQCH